MIPGRNYDDGPGVNTGPSSTSALGLTHWAHVVFVTGQTARHVTQVSDFKSADLAKLTVHCHAAVNTASLDGGTIFRPLNVCTLRRVNRRST